MQPQSKIQNPKLGLRIKIRFFNMMKPVVEAIHVEFSNDHCLHYTVNAEKSDFDPYIYTFYFLNSF